MLPMFLLIVKILVRTKTDEGKRKKAFKSFDSNAFEDSSYSCFAYATPLRKIASPCGS